MQLPNKTLQNLGYLLMNMSQYCQKLGYLHKTIKSCDRLWSNFKTNQKASCNFNPLQHNAAFLMHLRYIAVENIVRKGEIACNKQFLLFSQCFLPYKALTFHFKCTLKCCLQFVSSWTSLKFCCLVMDLKVS